VKWLREGDRNTNFFHRKVNWRQSKNRIKRIRGTNENWTDDPIEIEAVASMFFQELYTKDDSVSLEELLNLIHTLVLEETNKQLCKPFSDEEIGDALFQIGPIKAPGPDGLPGRFYQ
jgi:hypothetical protein